MNYSKMPPCLSCKSSFNRPGLTWILVLLAFLLIENQNATAEVILPGDPIYVIRSTPLKVKTDTTANVPAGTKLEAGDINGKWVWIRYPDPTNGFRLKEGWIDSANILKRPKGKSEASPAIAKRLNPKQYVWYSIPKGQSIEFQFDCDHSQLDFFVFSEEDLEAYKKLLDTGDGKVSSSSYVLNKQKGTLDWTPKDNDQYYLLIDNTIFPSKGADGKHSVNVTTFFWKEVVQPPEPKDDKGLIIGKVRIKFDNFKEKNEVYEGPLTAVIGYKDKVESGEKPKPDGEIEAKVDKNGFFFAGNVPKDRFYWIQSIKTPTFESPVPFKFYSQVDYEKDEPTFVDFGPACITSGMEPKQTGVLDIGYYDLKVVSDGSIVIMLTIPLDQFSNEKSINIFGTGKNLETELSRHAWFKSSFSSSGWTEKVVADLKWIQDERARMRKRKTGSKNPFAPDPPKKAPAPKKDSSSKKAPVPAPKKEPKSAPAPAPSPKRAPAPAPKKN
ncbi:hypothetical protein Pan241w_26290 [Gimesia alba]|uniref:Uncharacterized protein n=1 Tax=Gimesia alba TaxID=2527973 RepID=A0A517RF89_9PLAN|nr:hypothetical protein [Gimesia alba]QDT42544.1 hypothetical protein Pan241w_26290 [Gimesia alba]